MVMALGKSSRETGKSPSRIKAPPRPAAPEPRDGHQNHLLDALPQADFARIASSL
jgi:hypothetical protein